MDTIGDTILELIFFFLLAQAAGCTELMSLGDEGKSSTITYPLIKYVYALYQLLLH